MSLTNRLPLIDRSNSKYQEFHLREVSLNVTRIKAKIICIEGPKEDVISEHERVGKRDFTMLLDTEAFEGDRKLQLIFYKEDKEINSVSYTWEKVLRLFSQG